MNLRTTLIVLLGIVAISVLGTVVYRILLVQEEGSQRFRLTTDLARRGLEVATSQGCIACHSLDGRPGIGPTWLGMYGKIENFKDGGIAVVDDAYVRESIRRPEARVVEGFENLMVPYPLSPGDMEAVVEFTRQLRDPLPAGAGYQ